MSLEPGQSPKGDAQHTETRIAAETISPGEAVALDTNDELVLADTNNEATVYGVADYNTDGSDHSSGDLVRITVSGPVVAKLAADVAAGQEVTSSATPGELGTGTSAKGILTMYTEGEAGSNDVPSIDAGYGYVWL